MLCITGWLQPSVSHMLTMLSLTMLAGTCCAVLSHLLHSSHCPGPCKWTAIVKCPRSHTGLHASALERHRFLPALMYFYQQLRWWRLPARAAACLVQCTQVNDQALDLSAQSGGDETGGHGSPHDLGIQAALLTSIPFALSAAVAFWIAHNSQVRVCARALNPGALGQSWQLRDTVACHNMLKRTIMCIDSRCYCCCPFCLPQRVNERLIHFGLPFFLCGLVLLWFPLVARSSSVGLVVWQIMQLAHQAGGL